MGRSGWAAMATAASDRRPASICARAAVAAVSMKASNRSTLCPAAADSLVFLGSTEPDGQGVPTPARQSVANLDGGPRSDWGAVERWGVESVSENCATGSAPRDRGGGTLRGPV